MRETARYARAFVSVLAGGPALPGFNHTRVFNGSGKNRFDVAFQANCHLWQGVMPRFALAGGFLSGRYRAKADLASDRGAEVAGYVSRTGAKVLAALDEVAAAHDAALPSVALAWLLSKPTVVAPIVSASSPDQVFDLVSAAQLRLTRHENLYISHERRRCLG